MSEVPPLPYEGIPLTPQREKPYKQQPHPHVEYSEEIAAIILDRMCHGESLKAICQDSDMPHASSVCNWVVQRENFRDRYHAAMEARAYTLAEEILEIADTQEEGERTEEGYGPEGAFSKTVREDMLGHRKLKVDARKWLIVRMAPKRFGDKITQEHTGANGAALIPIITVNGKSAGG